MASNPNKNNKNNKTFFKDFKAELKKVVWPTPKQLANNTVLDLAFDVLNKYGINKIKGIVDNTTSNTLVEEGNNEVVDENTTDENTTDEGATDENTTGEEGNTEENNSVESGNTTSEDNE